MDIGESAESSEERTSALVESVYNENSRVILDSKEFVAWTILNNTALKTKGSSHFKVLMFNF